MGNVLRLTDEQYNALRRRNQATQKPAARVPAKERVDAWPIVLRDQIVSAGLPEPFREHCFHRVRGWRLDLAWPELSVAIEVDGMVHRIKGRFLSDLDKHNALLLGGWRYGRVTPAMVRDGTALELVRAMLAGA